MYFGINVFLSLMVTFSNLTIKKNLAKGIARKIFPIPELDKFGFNC